MSNTLFPTSIDAPTDPTSANTLNNPPHHLQHGFANDAIVAIENVLGITGSVVSGTVAYILGGVSAGDKAASLTGAQTLTNKVLGSGAAINLGSDGTGDIYYRNSSGLLARLPIGSNLQILSVAGGIPVWINNPAASNGSTTVAGIFQGATAAQINAGTANGSTGAALVITPDQLILSNYLTSSSVTVFGGTGSDGALSITSGTTTLAMGNVAVYVKNYTSISITGNGVLAFSGPNTNGTTIILKSQGAVTLTSSATPMINAALMGASGAAAVVAGNNGNTGNAGKGIIVQTAGGGAGVVGNTNVPGSSPTLANGQYSTALARYPQAVPGSGGGSGSSASNGGSGNSGGGGTGGAALVIECGGALNFTTTSGISVAGGAATNPTFSGSGYGGGGGGGGGGYFLCLYSSLTANSGTVTVSGGAISAGTGSISGDANGGATGGCSITASSSASVGNSGGSISAATAGAAGASLIQQYVNV